MDDENAIKYTDEMIDAGGMAYIKTEELGTTEMVKAVFHAMLLASHAIEQGDSQ